MTAEVATPTAAPGAASRLLVVVAVYVGLVVAAVASLGAPLITAVAERYHVSLAAAQWTLTITLLSGAITTPVLGRLGSGPRRRAAVLGTLAVVVAGSVLTVLPLPFAVLLVGRAAQGAGLGLTALMMAVARDHLPEARSARTISLLSVASTAGIGVGYPLAGLLADLAGIRAAYALGLVVTGAALVAALALPQAPPRRAGAIDLPGTLLLTVALLALLVVISETDLWREHTGAAIAVLVASLFLLAIWTVIETRRDQPLVDIRLLRRPVIAAANVAMFTGGIGMYLLLSLITRYLQTPARIGYGFGLDTFQAGLALVPFSVLGFAAGRLSPRMRARFGAHAVLAGSTVVLLSALVVFAAAHGQLAEPLIAMSLLGIGVGTFSAAMPAVILAATPQAETASAMSVNQVVRSVGFSVGSALGGLVLAGYTTGAFPRESGYPVAAWIGVGVMALTLAIVGVTSPRKATDGRSPS